VTPVTAPYNRLS